MPRNVTRRRKNPGPSRFDPADLAFARAWEVYATGLGGWTVLVDTDENGVQELYVDPPLVYGDGFRIRREGSEVVVHWPSGSIRTSSVRKALLALCELPPDALMAVERLTAAPDDELVVSTGRGSRLVSALLNETGQLELDRVAERFGMTKRQLAESLGLPSPATRKSGTETKTQARTTEMLEIVGRIVDWAGGEKQAMAWYRAEPIPAFGGRTAEALVKDGKAGAVRDFLDHVATGGFA